MQELKEALKSLPNSSGVYQFFDAKYKLLYVGKAKNLSRRVRSYFAPSAKLGPRQELMAKQTAFLNIVLTNSESDALLLENSLIKQLRPHFNVLLRDDKTYPYIYSDLSEEFPRFELTRRVVKSSKEAKIRYWGPYASGCALLIEALYLCFKLRRKHACSANCLYIHLGSCYGPKAKRNDAYMAVYEEAVKALSNPAKLRPLLEQKMQSFAQNENYEEAARIRDMLRAASLLKENSQIDLASTASFELFALELGQEYAAYARVTLIKGRVASIICKRFALGSKGSGISESAKASDDKGAKVSADKSAKANETPLPLDSESLDQLYSRLLINSFAQGIIPSLIYVQEDFASRALLKDMLSEKAAKSVQIKVAKSLDAKKVLDFALTNVRAALLKPKAEHLGLLEQFFELKKSIERIEIFDCSQFMGQAKVGAMVVYDVEEGFFDKANYRLFHLEKSSDYEQMREMLLRRIKQKEGQSKEALPDLWLLDGGKALLDLAQNLIDSLGANVYIMAISKEKVQGISSKHTRRAKGSAKDVIYYEDLCYKLSENHAVLMFLQMLRDEAHRFAIKFHRSSKRKEDLGSSKLKSLGLSDAKIALLLRHFSSFKAILKASEEDLESLVGKAWAGKIKELEGEEGLEL